MVSALLRLRRGVVRLRLRRRLPVVVIVHHARVVQRRVPVVALAGVGTALSAAQQPSFSACAGLVKPSREKQTKLKHECK